MSVFFRISALCNSTSPWCVLACKHNLGTAPWIEKVKLLNSYQKLESECVSIFLYDMDANLLKPLILFDIATEKYIPTLGRMKDSYFSGSQNAV